MYLYRVSYKAYYGSEDVEEQKRLALEAENEDAAIQELLKQETFYAPDGEVVLEIQEVISLV